MKKWGSMTEQDIRDWENLPTVERVLTSGQFGCWLAMRDDNLVPQIVEKMRKKIEDRYMTTNPDFKFFLNQITEEVIREERRGKNMIEVEADWDEGE